MVELDTRNAALAEERAQAAGLHQVDVVTADASLTDHYRGMVPADLVLVCGVFGNITDGMAVSVHDATLLISGNSYTHVRGHNRASGAG